MCVGCGHKQHEHRSSNGPCTRYADDLMDPFEPGAEWRFCECRSFTDAVLPSPGERLQFGVHSQRTPDAETAAAWPSMAAWSASLRGKTRRRLERLR